MKPRQLTTVEEAVSRIKDGDVFSFNGIGAIGFPDQFFPAMEARFLKEGHPEILFGKPAAVQPDNAYPAGL